MCALAAAHCAGRDGVKFEDIFGGFESLSSQEKVKIYLLGVLALAMATLAIVALSSASAPTRCSPGIFGSSAACVLQLATSTRNASMCSSLTGTYLSRCYSEIANETSNYATCAPLSAVNQSVYSSCILPIAISADEPSACGNLQDPYESECMLKIATARENLSACGFLAGINNTVCRSAINMSNALSLSSPSMCAYTSDQANADLLRSILSYSRLNESNAIDVVIAAEAANASARDVCYSILAMQSGTLSQCKSVSNSNLRMFCNATTVSYTNSSFNYTAMLHDCSLNLTSSGICTFGVTLTQALSTKNASYCGKLSGSYSTQCYYGMARTFNDTSYCSYITNPAQNYGCTSGTLNQT